eukprot:1144241-Pelagomonas_calceolata.AAC.4
MHTDEFRASTRNDQQAMHTKEFTASTRNDQQVCIKSSRDHHSVTTQSSLAALSHHLQHSVITQSSLAALSHHSVITRRSASRHHGTITHS